MENQTTVHEAESPVGNAPVAPLVSESHDRVSFWDCPVDLDEIPIRIAPPAAPLAILERLGPSPFPRGGFPLIGFLATTYEKVSRYALDGM